ncbi:calcium-binding protein [Pseudonocardia alni]|uniref:calcium-binding protein n=1 Tax=Pseudonocardia alni TaxID=33907 RepID=UPI00332B4889
MRLRSLSAAVLLATAAALPLAGTAFAQDRDCKDFASQADAQAALTPGDPENLDANDNGVACEDHDYGTATSTSDDVAADSVAAAGSQVTATPVGGVEAGGGPADVLPLALGAVVAGGIGAVAVRRVAAGRRG